MLSSGAFAGTPVPRLMSVNHGVYSSPESEMPAFLDVVSGMTVAVRHDHMTGEKADKDWWMGK